MFSFSFRTPTLFHNFLSTSFVFSNTSCEIFFTSPEGWWIPVEAIAAAGEFDRGGGPDAGGGARDDGYAVVSHVGLRLGSGVGVGLDHLAPGDFGRVAKPLAGAGNIDDGGVTNQSSATANYTDANGDPQTTSDGSDDNSNAEDDPTVTPIAQLPSLSMLNPSDVSVAPCSTVHRLSVSQ